MRPDRFAWIQVTTGSVSINGSLFREGDGLQINSLEQLEITTEANAEFLLFDLK
jgi:quercetin 2,3-dioxygenase